MPENSELSSFARRLPPSLLRGHVIMGAIQIAVGCLLVYSNIYSLLTGDFSVSARRTFSGFWTAPVFIAAGATGVVGGGGRCGTRCCLASCLALSVLAGIVAVGAIAVNFVMWLRPFGFASYADILWLIAYLLETVVAIVQAAFIGRALCCRHPAAEVPDGQTMEAMADPRPPAYVAAAKLGKF